MSRLDTPDIHELLKEQYYSATNGNLENVKLLISFNAEFNNAVPGGEFPICEASLNGNFEVVKYLLQNRADPNVRYSFKNETPLILAINHSFANLDDSVKTIKILLNYSADPNLEDQYGDNAYIYAELSNIDGIINLFHKD